MPHGVQKDHTDSLHVCVCVCCGWIKTTLSLIWLKFDKKKDKTRPQTAEAKRNAASFISCKNHIQKRLKIENTIYRI